MEEPRFLNKEAWKGIAIAIIAVVIGQVILAWQYYRLEENRLPLIEQQITEQKEEFERKEAKETLFSFLDALEQGEANIAQRFLTENSVLQEEQGVFSLEQKILDYKLISLTKLKEGEFRANVQIERENQFLPQIETLLLLKILDTYFVDSVEIAG